MKFMSNRSTTVIRPFMEITGFIQLLKLLSCFGFYYPSLNEVEIAMTLTTITRLCFGFYGLLWVTMTCLHRAVKPGSTLKL